MEQRRSENQSEYKNVTVLLPGDVNKQSDNLVFKPNTMKMAEIRKPKKGQYASRIKFTSEMTKLDVEKQLRATFPILSDPKERFYCASAVDGGGRLEFHGGKQIWSGDKIKQRVKGNSALYVLTEGTPEATRSQQASIAVADKEMIPGTAPGAGAMKSSSLPVSVQTGQKKRAARKRKIDDPTQQQSVTSLHNQGKINYVFVQPDADYSKQMQPVFLPASPSPQTGNQVFIATSIQHQDLKDDTTKWGCSSPKTFPTTNAQGMAKMASLGSVGPCQHVQNWQIAPQQVFTPVVQHSLSKHIAHTVTTPTALSRNLSTTPQQTLVGTGLATLQHALSQTASNANQVQSTGKVDPMHSLVSELVETVSDTEALDSAYETVVEDCTNVAYGKDESRGFIEEITPSSGYLEGGKKFFIILNDILPDNVTSYVAFFEDCGNVPLKKTNPFTLTGVTPKSNSPGEKEVTLVLMSANRSKEGGRTSFMYINKESQAFEQILASTKLQSEFFVEMSKRVRSEHSGLQTSFHSGPTDSGLSNLSENTNSWSVKVLKVLVYKAAQVGGDEFLRMIFSTSAGKVVFSSYKNNAVLPEDVATANGHTTLAYYLQDMNDRLSNESDRDARNKSIDWLELKYAVDKEHRLPGTEDVQTLKKWPPPSCRESDDDDESDYFADGETSPSSSPSDKVSDSDNAEGTSQMSGPPQIKEEIKIPRMRDLLSTSPPLSDSSLPIDFLLLTVKPCEFFSCFHYLQNPKRYYFKDLGYVYIGKMGDDDDDDEKLSVALVKCDLGFGVGGSLIVVKDAVITLRPKGVFSVGFCGSMNANKAKLGDVVVSSKLVAYAPAPIKVTEGGRQRRGTTVPLSKRFNDIMRHAGDGWRPPLKDSKQARKVVPGVMLSGPELVNDVNEQNALLKDYPDAIAIEMEGVITAAHDFPIEWGVVKGISDYADGTKTDTKDWQPYASLMAASVVAHILSSPAIFKDWPHYGDESVRKSVSPHFSSGLLSLESFVQRLDDTPHDISITAARRLMPKLRGLVNKAHKGFQNAVSEVQKIHDNLDIDLRDIAVQKKTIVDWLCQTEEDIAKLEKRGKVLQGQCSELERQLSKDEKNLRRDRKLLEGKKNKLKKEKEERVPKSVATSVLFGVVGGVLLGGAIGGVATNEVLKKEIKNAERAVKEASYQVDRTRRRIKEKKSDISNFKDQKKKLRKYQATKIKELEELKLRKKEIRDSQVRLGKLNESIKSCMVLVSTTTTRKNMMAIEANVELHDIEAMIVSLKLIAGDLSEASLKNSRLLSGNVDVKGICCKFQMITSKLQPAVSTR